MCGICGVIGTHNSLAEKRLRAMLRALVHRGPDDEGVLVRSGTILGVRRLSILDICGGSQPIYNETGDVAVICNGEIYNFRQLRIELESLGHRFRTGSDSETIVHAYEQWSDRCVNHLHGMFALAVWDSRDAGSGSGNRGRVFLARDRFGIKPLYYTIIAGMLFFASELRALLASESIPRCLSRDAVEGFLLFGSVVEPTTLLQGVYSLPAGHSLSVPIGHATAPQISRYWELSPRVSEFAHAPATVRSAARLVRGLLETAVREQLFAEVPAGIFLSGGLDSAALAAVGARECGRVQTFTLSFPEQEFDEATPARETARYLGTSHHELLLTIQDVKARLGHAVGALDQPSMDGMNTFFLSWGARRAGLKVALSGLGADELFGGYPAFRLAPYLINLLRIASRLPKRTRELNARQLVKLSHSELYRNRADRLHKVAALFTHPEELPHAYFFARLLFTPVQARRLLSPGIEQIHPKGPHAGDCSYRSALEECVCRAETFHSFSAISYLELRTYTLNTLLRDTDSMSMYHSLEVRVPFLDHRLVELVQALPPRVKHKSGTPKALLAEAVKDFLPHQRRGYRKHAFTLPWEQWLRGELGALVGTRLQSLTPSLASMLNAEAVQSVWRTFESRTTGWARPWSLFVLNEWVRAHIDEPISRTECAVESASPAATV